MRSPARHPRLAALALAIPLLLAACAAVSPSPSPTPPGPIDHPTDDTVIFRIEYQGGLMGPDFLFPNYPVFVLLGDGRVIMEGAQIESFPGPALPAIIVRQLTEAGVQAILREVAATAQFGASVRWHAADTMVADGSDAIFTLRAEGREIVVSVYALGQVSPDLVPPGMTATELAAHAALLQLVNRVTLLESWLPSGAWATAQWVPYVPDAMRLVARNADADPPDNGGLPPGELPWPVAGDPATFGSQLSDGRRCAVVTDDELDAWYAALASANQLTLFTFEEHRYQVAVWLLLPDDPRVCERPT
ncbi:MAG TPA: hypothetical protein VJA85_01265 [Candidatus Limnocylindria bacterium]|nr:hypothetical protein [Candidatus Limnocylindria bacterium]